jgi:hypothetical protein
MRRELLRLEEMMIDAAEQAHVALELHGAGRSLDAAPIELKTRFAEVPWQQPTRLRNRIDPPHDSQGSRLPGFAESLRKVLVLVQAGDADGD